MGANNAVTDSAPDYGFSQRNLAISNIGRSSLMDALARNFLLACE